MDTDHLFSGTQRPRKRKEGKNDVKLNPAISPPYAQKWPEIKGQHREMVVEEIENAFRDKVEDQLVSKKRKKLVKKRPEESAEKIEQLLMTIFGRIDKYKETDLSKLIASESDPSKLKDTRELKQYFVIGARDISRFIDRNVQFNLIICCGSSDNWICKNLLCSALLSNIPVCSINGLSEVLAELFAITQMTALGFKKTESSPFNDLAEFIIDKIPDVSSPWTRLWGQKYTVKVSDNNEEGEDEGAASEEGAGTTVSTCDESRTRGKRRKVDGSDNHGENDSQYVEMNIEWKEKKNVAAKKGIKAVAGKQTCKK